MIGMGLDMICSPVGQVPNVTGLSTGVNVRVMCRKYGPRVKP